MQPNSQDLKRASPPEQPNQPSLPRKSSMARTIQPLSSEESIRSEVFSAQHESPAVAGNTVNTQGEYSDSSAITSADSYEQGGLITEPIKRPHQATADQSGPLHQQSTLAKKPSSGKGPFVAIVAVAVVIAAGVGAYLVLFKSQVAGAELISETAQKTSYQRPKEWQLAPVSLGIETFTGKIDESSAMASVTIDEGIGVTYHGDDKPDDFIDSIRTNALVSSSVHAMKGAFEIDGKPCMSEIDLRKEKDTRVKGRAIGLMYVTGTCTKSDGTYMVKMRVIMEEKDGLQRHVIVATTEDEWSENKVTFDAILDSIEPLAEE